MITSKRTEGGVALDYDPKEGAILIPVGLKRILGKGEGLGHVSTFLLLQASCHSCMPHMPHRNQSSVLEAGDVSKIN